MSKKKIIETEVCPAPAPTKVVEPTETKKSAIQPNANFDNEEPVFVKFNKGELRMLRKQYVADLEELESYKAEFARCVHVASDNHACEFFQSQLSEVCSTISALKKTIDLMSKYIKECTE